MVMARDPAGTPIAGFTGGTGRHSGTTLGVGASALTCVADRRQARLCDDSGNRTARERAIPDGHDLQLKYLVESPAGDRTGIMGGPSSVPTQQPCRKDLPGW